MRIKLKRKGLRAMKKVMTAFGLVIFAIVGCIIIPSKHEINAHIQLDIRLEREAAQILDFIEGKTDEVPVALPGEGGEKKGVSWVQRAKDFLSPVGAVYAQDLKSDSAKARELMIKLRDRRPIIDDLKAKGYIGEDNRGYVALMDHEDLKDPQKKNEVQRTIHEENTDRKALYKEIADLNQDRRASLSQVERVFAKAYRQRAQSGHYIQLPGDSQELAEFKETATGKKLGDAVKPGAWVRLP